MNQYNRCLNFFPVYVILPEELLEAGLDSSTAAAAAGAAAASATGAAAAGAADSISAKVKSLKAATSFSSSTKIAIG